MLPSLGYVLHHRFYRRAAPISGHGGPFAVGHQRRDKKQLQEKEGRDYPDYLIACVGGGSNAAGTIYHYIDDERVRIVLAEAGGKGIETGMTAATIQLGKWGSFMGHVRL